MVRRARFGPSRLHRGGYREPQDRCSPPGRGLGARPTTPTGDRLHDAKPWIETPGGVRRRLPARNGRSPGPGARHRGPPAGTGFPEQALELARPANPAIMR
nr:glycoside hydrolase family 6 protein [Streptomyces cirratus]